MALISALTELTRANVVDTDYLVVVDRSAGVAGTKRMDIDSLLGALDGDQLDIDFTPTNYTPDAVTPAEADDADDLTAHLQGIDTRLGQLDVLTTEQSDTTFTVGTTSKYVEIDTSGGAVTATLPSAATLGAGWHYIIKVTDATAATTIATNGAETIDGADAWVLTHTNEVLEIVSDGTNWKMIRWDLPRVLKRPKFTYATATSFTISTFCMRTPTLDYPKVYIKAKVTVYGSSGGGGSNANNTDLDTTGWHYVYIDASAVDTQNSPLLDADCFLLSTDEPDFDSNYGLWVGDATSNTTTSDICIFAVLVTSASTIYKFFHDGGDAVIYDAWLQSSVYSPADTNWGAVSGTSGFTPCFIHDYNNHAYIEVWGDASGACSDIDVLIRPSGSSGTGWQAGQLSVGAGDNYLERVFFPVRFPVSAAGLEMKYNVATAAADAWVMFIGYFLPEGL